MTDSPSPSPVLVRDLMTVGVATCSPSTPIEDLARLILEKGIEDIVVLEDGNAVGRIGQDELLKVYAQKNYRDLKAEDIMVEGIPQVPPDIPLTAAAQIMLDLGVRTLFLTHHAGGIEYPAAAISYWHILRHMTAHQIDDLSDLGIKAERQSPIEAFIQKRDEARRKKISK